MRPARLEVQNFRGWKQGEVELDRPLVVIVAENRRGKSSTLNALEWCLFGQAIEKKGCGILERAEWLAAHRAPHERSSRGARSPGARSPVRAPARSPDTIQVALTLQDERGATARLVRRRGAGAAARTEDDFAIETPEGERLDGARATAWLQRSTLPDWDTWRRAFCQHQELVRSRLTEGGDRSSILAALLGLEEYDCLHALLKEQKPASLIKAIDDEQDQLEARVLQLLQRPEEELAECEQRLAALGVESKRVGSSLAVEVVQRMLARAKSLAGSLGFAAQVPTCASEIDLDAARAWAEAWAGSVRAERRSAERAPVLTRMQGELAGAIARLEPLEIRWKETCEERDRELRERGDEPTQRALLAQAESALSDAEERVRTADAARSLLRDAHDLVRAPRDPEHCPVCDTAVPELAARIDEALARAQGPASGELADAVRRAQERRDTLHRGLRDLKSKLQEEADARTSLEKARAKLSGLVPEGRRGPGATLIDGARDELRALEAELKKLQAAFAARDESLEQHARDLETVRELHKWRTAAARAEHRTTLDSTPAWGRLQAALDAAAGFAADVDALGAMAREAQESCSSRRESEVNRSLGAFFALITGDESGQSVRVRAHRTAKGLHYELEDEDGERALSTWNQASLNALSLALLFAQAEERARAHLSAWIVLDDPAQGLDDEHQAGLARAIARAAASCPVILATPPGALGEALLDLASIPRRVIRLAPWQPESGVRVLEQEGR